MKIAVNNKIKLKQESNFIGIYENAASSEYCNKMIERFD